jgi:nucleotide-binding universal stress UspA family protein
LPASAEAKLVSVIEPFLPSGPPDAACGVPFDTVNQHDTGQAAWAVRQRIASLHRAFPTWVCGAMVRRGMTACQLVAAAAAWQAGLLVISPWNRGAWARFLCGSFSRNVVETAPCSVRVARLVKPDKKQGLRLLLGYDGSRAAAVAVCEVAMRRWPPYTQVRLVLVNQLSFPAKLRSWSSRKADPRFVPHLLESAAEFLCGSGLRVSLAQRVGSPQQVLLEVAAHWGAHCIFLGASLCGGFKQLFFGSTSAVIASQAHCTVEIVREDFPQAAPTRLAARQPSFKTIRQVSLQEGNSSKGKT